ncbi:hypothetical protein [Cronobacter malonaticus]|uniref:hypothetical protein n=1 Tax=Cronobacter malonaticus TaxID=413503 RepID=UPI001D45E99A|nr:hypothetical protein [Cronobacter malonaticus]EGT4415646.1 hypothetical protein [Cronobacter malonaticus]ELY6326610.1 hypothetical protein [Cronobacter malonaticus]ELY6418728.1 hypothetical protein [Cronobacter malonaticus]EMD9400759.1 hypothetical protein [Cronobacter malonaticus]
MKERGMIFNAEMVRAILDGRKTQTRRIMKPQPEACPRGGHWWPSNVFKTMLHVEEEMQNGKGGWDGLVGDACPFGAVGDRIWVRETWARYNIDQSSHDMAYRATTPEDWPEEGRWRPSIHMPRWASRITLEITGVRVERLASISSDDARDEGYPAARAEDGGNIDPWLWFRDLWDGIYPEYSFKANPWVWVIEFKRVEGGAS